ncbi:MAG: hypothetical protein ACYTF1_17305 [Planctomycetota bacterium]|jgi:hypothetical protein
MDAFETLISTLLHHDGYWIKPSFKVDLTKEEKRKIGRASSPRWELDLVAYKGSSNEVLAVECKSFLDSTGVIFRNRTFEPEKRYKLFTDNVLRKVVLNRLAKQLQTSGSCAPSPRVILCLAAGKIAKKSDRNGMLQHFESKGWKLLDTDWVRERLNSASQSGYENDVRLLFPRSY